MMVSTTTPMVSVVIIFLNSERFLTEAIESVRGQTFTNWELLLVDDGSTDASSAIARGYAGREPDRVRYLEHDGHVNRGMSASRNLGVDRARGAWIAFIDSDDVWKADHLATMTAFPAAFPDVDLLYGPSLIWQTWAGGGDADRPQTLGVDGTTVLTGAALLRNYLENAETTPCTCALLVRRETFLRLSGFEEQFRGLYEDQVFYLKIALGARVLVTDRVTSLYRQHDDSCVALSLQTKTNRAGRLRYLQWARAYARRHGADREIDALLGRQIVVARRSVGMRAAARRLVRRIAPAPVAEWLRRHQ